MDRGKSPMPRLVRSSTVAESTGSRGLVRSSSVVETTSREADSVIVPTRWKPTPEQKRILESMFANGIRNPSTTYIAEITADLQRYGRVEGKNVFYWFQNANAREKRKKEPSQSKSSKWPTLFRSSKWPSLFRSKKSSDKNPADNEEEEVDSGTRRNSSIDTSEMRTLELFPLRPDRGGF